MSAAYDRAEISRGRQAWVAPRFLPLAAWLHTIFAESWPAEATLSELQEEFLWGELIGHGASRTDAPPLPRPSAIRLARDAHRLLTQWQCAPTADGSMPPECDWFLRLRQRFRERLNDAHWIDRAEAEARAVEAIRAGSISLPAQVRLAGFDELTPLASSLVAALRARGVAVTIAPSRAQTQGKVEMVRPPNERAELEIAARWCRERLREDPARRLAVVIPDLAARHDAARYAFEEELSPSASLLADADARHGLFEISFAPPLGERPIVAFALSLFHTLQADFTAADTSRLLRSPFVAEAESEYFARARFDAELRKKRVSRYPLAWLEEQSRAADRSAAVPRLAALLASLLAAQREIAAPRRPSAWSEFFRRVLDGAGWPGERTQNSGEFQARERFSRLLSEFAALDLVSGAIDLAGALDELNGAAAKVAFQPQGVDAPVQILGTLEAAGLDFDAVWITSFHTDAWPIREQPHPLLPREWQDQHGLPGASSSREQARHVRRTAELLALAPYVIVSVPLEVDDRDAAPTAMIDLPIRRVDLQPARPLAQLLEVGSPSILEHLEPDPAPPIAESRGQTGARQRGGVRIFADQAACPFRAFARHRLAAAQVEPLEELLDPLERGEFLHASLEDFWRRCRSHGELASWSDEERRAHLVSSIASAAARHLEPRRDLIPLVRRVEERRALALLLDWLALEALRAPFRVVELESCHPLLRGGVRVEVRIDRIDCLDDGSLVFIDYKTGARVQAPSWTEQRLEEPQLPLYVSAGKRQVAAVAIAGLQRDRLGYLGVAARNGLLPGVKAFAGEAGEPSGFQELLAFWYQATLRIGEEFAAGIAPVDPKHPRNTCKDCDLHALCRIGDRSFGAGQAGDEETDTEETAP